MGPTGSVSSSRRITVPIRIASVYSTRILYTYQSRDISSYNQVESILSMKSDHSHLRTTLLLHESQPQFFNHEQKTSEMCGGDNGGERSPRKAGPEAYKRYARRNSFKRCKLQMQQQGTHNPLPERQGLLHCEYSRKGVSHRSLMESRLLATCGPCRDNTRLFRQLYR